VRILLDQNLSPKLIRRLEDVLPGLIFSWARRMGFAALITTDLDLVHLVEQVGPPPKVIRIERCDFRLAVIEELFRRESERIRRHLASDEAVLAVEL